jgi:hypothetical protein
MRFQRTSLERHLKTPIVYFDGLVLYSFTELGKAVMNFEQKSRDGRVLHKIRVELNCVKKRRDITTQTLQLILDLLHFPLV